MCSEHFKGGVTEKGTGNTGNKHKTLLNTMKYQHTCKASGYHSSVMTCVLSISMVESNRETKIGNKEQRKVE